MPQKSRKKKFAAAQRRPAAVRAAASENASAPAPSSQLGAPATSPVARPRAGVTKGQAALPPSAAASNVGREVRRIAVLSAVLVTLIVVVAFLIR